MTTIALSYRSIDQKIRSIDLPKINWMAVYTLGILLSFLMLVSYVFLVNDLTANAYLMKKYDQEMGTVIKESRVLEANFTEAGLLSQIMENTVAMKLEKTANVKYIQILESSLAKAN